MATYAMESGGTIRDTLARHRPDSRAILDAEGRAMTYGQLVEQADRTAARLRDAGIGAGDAVASVVANGPHAATSFLSIASSAVAAPLHPGLTQREFRQNLESLQAKAVLLDSDAPPTAAAAARELRVAILHLEPTSSQGGFALRAQGDREALPGRQAPGGDTDAALLLHTSGTTARPKLVPLTEANLTASAASVAETLRLSPADTSLNLMPLFHIHGLVGVLLASLHAGASVVATPGFSAMRFFRWLEELRPTWYSAVPTMHQAILQRSGRNLERLAHHSLRLVRSSSAALPPSVFAALEERFGCPVIEAYGMTEAAHQMASNPLPPAQRMPGTVGVAAGPEVAVMDAGGTLLPPGTKGEVVIRGPNVTAGYLDNAEANASSFTNGWFRTGDQGLQDEDGYFTITGRLKELINRGGEKISPREIDEALLQHPHIAQAVAFAAPHAKLGEEIGAAIVLRQGAALTQWQVRDFVADRIAGYKVPRIIRFVESIPKGPSGKLKRVGLAKDLGIG